MHVKLLAQCLKHSKDSINIALSIHDDFLMHSTFSPFDKVKIYLRVLSVIELIL
jgi:hypothetical protein